MSRAETARSAGALAVLAGCFFLSGLLRTGSVVAALPELPDLASEPQSAAGEAATAQARSPAELAGLAAELRRQRELLVRREEALTEREQLLSALEDRLEVRLGELAEAQRKLEATAALVDDAAAKDVRRLAGMYEQMKPKQAGRIFNEMDPSFAAGFLAEMKPDAAALIMASMDSGKAYAVSLLLAGRNVGRQ